MVAPVLKYGMVEFPPIPWAKLKTRFQATSGEGPSDAWLSLVDHAADVTAVFEAMLELPVVRKRLACLAGLEDLTSLIRQRLCAHVALHDFGKANVGFQARWRASAPMVGHCREALIALIDSVVSSRVVRVLPLLEMMRWGAFENAVHAILSHHGRPIDPSVSVGDLQKYWTPVADYDPVKALAPLGDAVRTWFPAAFSTGGPELPGRASFWHGVAGLVTLADWIASDESNFPLLPLFEGGEPISRMAASRNRARLILRKIGFDPTEPRAGCVASRGFQAISEHSPRPVQVATASWSERDSVLVLESETGSGKTEAALARFARLFAAGEVDGLYFALPTRVAATSLHARVLLCVERLFPDPARRPAVILAVPGVSSKENVATSPIEAPRAGIDVWEASTPKDAGQTAWAAERPKKYLAGTIAVGTIDQALLGIVTVKHAHLRLSSLMRHLLVVDEVHASDRYMAYLLSALIRFYRKAGGHALLLSATLGASARSALLDGDDPPCLSEAIAAPYPAISSERHLAPVGQPWEGRAKVVSLEARHEIAAPDSIARLALQAAERGAKVLVIRNLRREAVDIFNALVRAAPDHPGLFRFAGVATLHHGRFAREDRARIDAAVEEALGKHRPEGGLVVVGTQTLEQSLDIDADFLITDLAPADVLLQRLGRLHRHAHRADRPDGFAAPRAIVLTPPDMDALLGPRGGHGLGGTINPYIDLIAGEATRRLIAENPIWSIPDMNRELVERATHPEAMRALADELAALNPEWRAAEARVSGKHFAMSQLGGAAILRTDFCFSNPSIVFPADEEISTRLGARDVAVALPEAVPGPFESLVQNFTVPAHWMKGLDAQGDLAVKVADYERHGFTFSVQGRVFRYDARGLQPTAAPERL